MKLERIVHQKQVNLELALQHERTRSHSSGRSRFRTEAEAIARLQHPNIVQVYEVGEHENEPFLALEFCVGGSLKGQLNVALAS
jgi:serine/threonine protein kinase